MWVLLKCEKPWQVSKKGKIGAAEAPMGVLPPALVCCALSLLEKNVASIVRQTGSIPAHISPVTAA